MTAETSPRRDTVDLGIARTLTIAALGVVYGDIGTSPLYAVRQSLIEFGETSERSILGVVSLITWSLLLVVIALFVFIYRPTIEKERTDIRARFPDAYESYEANVPAFTPRLTPWRGQSGGESFSFSLYMRQREWQAGLAFLAVTAWLVTRSRLGF